MHYIDAAPSSHNRFSKKYTNNNQKGEFLEIRAELFKAWLR